MATLYLLLGLVCCFIKVQTLSDACQDRLETLKREFSEYKARTDTEIEHLAGKLQRYEERADAALENEILIGFSAYKTSHQDTGSGDVVSFQNAPYNFGGGYDAITGRFTCPIPGVYFVSASLERHRDVDAAIYLGGVEWVGLQDSRTAAGEQFNSVTSTALMFCDWDQIIDVRAKGNGEIHGDSEDRLSTFTAFKLLY